MSRYRCLPEREFRGLSVEPRPFERIREKGVAYTYEQYLAHLEDTDRFAADHPRYQVEKTSSQTFRNLQISIHEGRWAMVSKELVPSIHFVIHHPKLRRAIEEFIPPVAEK